MLRLLLALAGIVAAPTGRRLSSTPRYYGALLGKKVGQTMTVYVAAGTTPAFEYDELDYQSASVAFTVPFASYEVHVPDASQFAGDDNLYVGIAGLTGSDELFRPGKLLPATWADGTDMSTVEIDYTDAQRTIIEIREDEEAITFEARLGR